MWHKFNPSPRGSSVGDCAVRAVAAATGQSWEQAYVGLAMMGYALGDMPSANRTWGAYLQKRGFKRHLVEADCSTCYTVEDFAREYPRGIYVLGCSGHVLAVIDGKLGLLNREKSADGLICAGCSNFFFSKLGIRAAKQPTAALAEYWATLESRRRTFKETDSIFDRDALFVSIDKVNRLFYFGHRGGD